MDVILKKHACVPLQTFQEVSAAQRLVVLHPAGASASCSQVTLISGKEAIHVSCMQKIPGAIFHKARMARWMTADGEGKVSKLRGWRARR